jgi:hypothetical protein
MMKRLLTLLLCAALAAPGCATAARGPRYQTSSPQATPTRSAADRAVLAEFARNLPVGARVKATTTGNRSVRGTLLKATDASIVIQPRTRVPEPLVEVPFEQLLALEQDQQTSNAGRTAGIAAAAAAGATLGVLFLLAAIFSD